ncbi:unnamed protein product, partial [Linum tenue]
SKKGIESPFLPSSWSPLLPLSSRRFPNRRWFTNYLRQRYARSTMKVPIHSASAWIYGRVERW